MNKVTETSPKAAIASGPETAAREALTGARLRAIAAVLDHYENRRSDAARLSRPVVVNNPQAIGAILDRHEARRAACGSSPAPVAVAVLLGSCGSAR